jgi:hypothetical protein
MMVTEFNKANPQKDPRFMITLQDLRGIIKNVDNVPTRYFVAREWIKNPAYPGPGEEEYLPPTKGVPVNLLAEDITYGWKRFGDIKQAPNKSPDISYDNKKADNTMVGIDNPDIVIECVIDLRDDTVGTTMQGEYIRKMDFKTLFDFISTPNVYYLKDWWGVPADGKTPIQTLINSDDIFGNEIYESAGMPVVIDQAPNLTRDLSQGGFLIRFKLQLKEDRNAPTEI